MYDFRQKIALVTGASRGIGRALACALAGQGARLFLLARTGQGAAETALHFVSSSVGRAMRAKWGAYAVSKWGVEGLMQLVAAEREQTGVVACSINPGGTATAMRHEAYPEEDPRRLPSAEQVAAAFVELLRRDNDQLNSQAFDARDLL